MTACCINNSFQLKTTKNCALVIPVNEPTTHHFPLLPIQLQHGGQRAGRGGRRGRSGRGGSERFRSGTYWGTWTPQGRILVGLLVIVHVLQAWKRQGNNYSISQSIICFLSNALLKILVLHVTNIQTTII